MHDLHPTPVNNILYDIYMTAVWDLIGRYSRRQIEDVDKKNCMQTTTTKCNKICRLQKGMTLSQESASPGVCRLCSIDLRNKSKKACNVNKKLGHDLCV